MMTIDRVARLLTYYRRPPLLSLQGVRLTPILNDLDRQAGIDTTGGKLYPSAINAFPYVNFVGRRIALHEDFIQGCIGPQRVTKTAYYFWLGEPKRWVAFPRGKKRLKVA